MQQRTAGHSGQQRAGAEHGLWWTRRTMGSGHDPDISTHVRSGLEGALKVPGLGRCRVRFGVRRLR